MPANHYRRALKAASERGRRMAAARWAKDRERREAEWAALSEDERRERMEGAREVVRDCLRPSWEITIAAPCEGGRKVQIAVYPAEGGRRDQWRVVIDGTVWRERCGLAELQKGIRRAMVRQSGRPCGARIPTR